MNTSGRTVEVETLEKSNYITEVTDKQKVETTVVEETKSQVFPGQLTIKDNQTGISYRKLFAEYLKGAKQIILTD